MSILLNHLVPAVLPLLHPTLSGPGVEFTTAFAEWVYEFKTPVGKAGNVDPTPVHKIDPTRMVCPFGRTKMAHEFLGYRNPDGSLRMRSLDRGSAAALAHGVVRAWYHQDKKTREVENHPRHALVDMVAAAAARASALRDVESHLRDHPIDVVSIDGVAVDAKPTMGKLREVREFERTVESFRPSSASGAAHALLRKVELEHVGVVGDVEHPEWLPTGFVAADALRAAATAATGYPVATTAVPAIQYQGSRIIWTPELSELLPVLEILPARMRVAPEAAKSRTNEAAPVTKVAPLATAGARRASTTRGSWAAVLDDMNAEEAA